MNKFYLIKDVGTNLYWCNTKREFGEYINANKFDGKIQAMTFVDEENIGVCEIITVYQSMR